MQIILTKEQMDALSNSIIKNGEAEIFGVMNTYSKDRVVPVMKVVTRLIEKKKREPVSGKGFVISDIVIKQKSLFVTFTRSFKDKLKRKE